MRLLAVLLVALVLPGTARGYYGFRLGGYHASPYMRAWARESRMPLPPDKVNVGFGNPAEYGPHSIYLPSCCTGGWTHQAIQGLFFHELGHVFDATMMTPGLRAKFRQIVGLPQTLNWWLPVKIWRYVSGPGVYVTIPLGEMFAEEYASCSLGLTQYQYENDGYNTYGWEPPLGTDPALCALIASAG